MEVFMNRRSVTVPTNLTAIFVLISLLAGCGKPETIGLSQERGQPLPAVTQPSALADGGKFENDIFSIMIPKGWSKIENPIMIRLIDDKVSGDTIQVTFLGSGEHNQNDGTNGKGIVDGYVKLYKASTPEEVNAFNKTWWKTTFIADDPGNTGYSSRYVRVTADGFLVEVNLTGKNHESNKELKAIQDTLVFKR
jgi:hypothetical protein